MKRYSHLYNDYISKCDLINKYNKKNLKLPKVQSIVFDIPINQIGNLSNLSLKNSTLITETKMFFNLYLNYCFEPYINYKSIKSSKKGSSLKIKFVKKIEIDSYLHDLFIYISVNLVFKYFIFIYKEKEKNTQLLQFKIPIFYMPELNLSTDFLFYALNLKDLSFFINFKFIHLNNSFNFVNYLRNIIYFWTLKTT